MSTKFKFRDPCEWNPVANRPAYIGEEHASSEIVVGHDGMWRICESCSRLPAFKKYKVRKPISKKEMEQKRDAQE